MIVAEAEFSGTPGVSARYRSATALLGAQLRIDNFGRTPDVGGSASTHGGNFCIVEEDGGRIWAIVYNAFGAAVAGWIQLTSSGLTCTNPSISNSTGRGSISARPWNIVWTRTSTPSPGVYGAQITHSGGILNSAFSMRIDGSRQYARPTVSPMLDGQSGALEYLAAWQSRPIAGGDWDIEYQIFRGPGPVGPPYRGSGSYNDVDPSVDSDGSTFLLAWSAAQGISGNSPKQLLARTLEYRGGLPVSSLVFPILTSPLNTDVRVASDASAGGSPQEFWAAWEWRGIVASNSHVYGAKIETEGFGHVYCPGRPNSVGSGATIRATGSRSLYYQDFSLRSSACPSNRAGLFFFGPTQINLPFGEGRRCVGGNLRRILPPVFTTSAGSAERRLDPGSNHWSAFSAGAPGLNFQFWYRDPGVDSDGDGTAEGWNLSAAIQVEFLN
jgi:hypothetical protein